MGKNKQTSQAIDFILKGLALGTITGSMLAAPNAVRALEKPLNHLLAKLDDREKQRALSKIRSYMKSQGLVRGSYDHGLILTKKAIKRIDKLDFDTMEIAHPDKWDNVWRIVFFDIPETQGTERRLFTIKLKSLGFQILQQSVWVYPYPCREEVAKICLEYDVAKWVTYVETSYIDNSSLLIDRFKLR